MSVITENFFEYFFSRWFAGSKFGYQIAANRFARFASQNPVINKFRF